MPPKGKDAGSKGDAVKSKGKGGDKSKPAAEEKGTKGKLKPATAINVRHILVSKAPTRAETFPKLSR